MIRTGQPAELKTPRRRSKSGFFPSVERCAGCGEPFLSGQPVHFARIVDGSCVDTLDRERFHEICLPVGAR